MRRRGGLPAKDRAGLWQYVRREFDGLPAVEVDIGQAVRRRAENDADVLRLAVEISGQVRLADHALLPACISRDFRFERQRQRIPAARDIGLCGLQGSAHRALPEFEFHDVVVLERLPVLRRLAECCRYRGPGKIMSEGDDGLERVSSGKKPAPDVAQRILGDAQPRFPA